MTLEQVFLTAVGVLVFGGLFTWLVFRRVTPAPASSPAPAPQPTDVLIEPSSQTLAVDSEPTEWDTPLVIATPAALPPAPKVPRTTRHRAKPAAEAPAKATKATKAAKATKVTKVTKAAKPKEGKRHKKGALDG